MRIIEPILVNLALFLISAGFALFWNLMDIMTKKKSGKEANRHFFGFIWGYLMCLLMLFIMNL